MIRAYKVKIRLPEGTMFFIVFSDTESHAVLSALEYTGYGDRNCFTSAWELNPEEKIHYIATEK